MIQPRQSIQSYIIDFIKEWKDKVNPIIKNYLKGDEFWIDLTEEFRDKKSCFLTYNKILSGQKVYGLIFNGCKGMAEKWELDERGNIKKDVYGKPKVKVYSTSVALVPLDLVVEFISTDEILPINKKFSGPYGLSQKWTEQLMSKIKCDSNRDLVFFFVSYPEDIKHKIIRFLKEMEYILEGGYLNKKGFLQMDGPQWREYYPSRELTDTSKLFLSSAIEGTFDKRRLLKTRLLDYKNL